MFRLFLHAGRLVDDAHLIRIAGAAVGEREDGARACLPGSAACPAESVDVDVVVRQDRDPGVGCVDGLDEHIVRLFKGIPAAFGVTPQQLTTASPVLWMIFPQMGQT